MVPFSLRILRRFGWHNDYYNFTTASARIMTNLKELPIGPSAPEVVHAVVEIPRGSRSKIEYDAELEVFKLDRVLFSAVHYPVAYGFIPSTMWHDGDPLDVLVGDRLFLEPADAHPPVDSVKEFHTITPKTISPQRHEGPKK